MYLWDKMQCGICGQIPESHCEPLELWSKAMPSAVDNYLAFGKQIQMGYWALVEMECLAMNHEMALLPGLLSMRKIPSNTPSHNVRAQAATQFEMEMLHCGLDISGDRGHRYFKSPMASTFHPLWDLDPLLHIHSRSRSFRILEGLFSWENL